jgi:hypothetical protein
MKVAPTFFYVTFLLCISLFSLAGTASAQDEDCLTTTLPEFMTCVGDNPCTCSSCGSVDSEFNPTLPITCAELNELLCPTVVCCSACSASLRAYYQCTVVDIFASAGFVTDGDCTLDCSSYPAQDEVDPTCDVEDYPCASEQADYTSCLLSCTLGDGCPDTSNQVTDLTDLEAQLANSGSTCETFNTYACSSGVAFNGCCSECDVLFANIFQCLANEDLQEECTIECADGEVAGPSGNPGDVPGENASPSEAPAEDPSSGGGAVSDPPTSAANGSTFASQVVLGAPPTMKILFAIAMFAML